MLARHGSLAMPLDVLVRAPRDRSSRERSEPLSLPQAVLGEGQARSARERARYRASTSIVATEEPPPAVTFSSGSVAMRVSAPSMVAVRVTKGATSTMRS